MGDAAVAKGEDGGGSAEPQVTTATVAPKVTTAMVESLLVEKFPEAFKRVR